MIVIISQSYDGLHILSSLDSADWINILAAVQCFVAIEVLEDIFADVLEAADDEGNNVE